MSNKRDTRIDILRGMALLFIVINHMTDRLYVSKMGGYSIPTPSVYGFSSAAELFVMLSGYMVGFVYLKQPDVTSRLIKRALQIYRSNLVTFACCLPFLLYMSTLRPDRYNLTYLHDSFFPALLGFLALTYAPFLLDIMRLYIALMIIAIPLIAISRRSELVAFLASGIVYVITITLYILDVRFVASPKFWWFANPLCWQFAFFIMILLGKRGFHYIFFARLNRMTILEHLVTWIVVIISAYASREAWLAQLPAGDIMGSKQGLGPVRLIHALLMLIFYGSVITLSKGYIAYEPFRTTAVMGKYSLQCFLLSVWLTYALVTLSKVYDGGYLAYIVGTLILILNIALFAHWKNQPSKIFSARL